MVSVIIFTEFPFPDDDSLGFLFSDNPQRGVKQSR